LPAPPDRSLERLDGALDLRFLGDCGHAGGGRKGMAQTIFLMGLFILPAPKRLALLEKMW